MGSFTAINLFAWLNQSGFKQLHPKERRVLERVKVISLVIAETVMTFSLLLRPPGQFWMSTRAVLDVHV